MSAAPCHRSSPVSSKSCQDHRLGEWEARQRRMGKLLGKGRPQWNHVEQKTMLFANSSWGGFYAVSALISTIFNLVHMNRDSFRSKYSDCRKTRTCKQVGILYDSCSIWLKKTVPFWIICLSAQDLAVVY